MAKILKELANFVKPGISTEDIEKLADELISFYKVKPAFLGFNDYPASTCISINEEVVHCVPSDRVIKSGDLVSIDMGIIFKGFNLDSAITVPALDKKENYSEWSSKNPKKSKLLEVTKKSLSLALSKMKDGASIGDIGYTIQSFVEKNGLVIVKELTGHGIGKSLHEEPQILNFGRPKEGIKLKEGMTVAIEPIVSVGEWRLKNSADGFGYETKDGSLSAHFEHTVAITKNGVTILTEE